MARRIVRLGRPTMTRTGSAPRRAGSPGPKLRYGWLKLIVLLALLAGTWRYFSVESIEIKNAQNLNKQGIELAVRKGLKAQLLGENLLTLNPGRLKGSVIGQIPEIKELKIERDWPKDLIITIVEREPSLAWRSGGVLYLLDRDGTVIREVSAKDAKLTVVTDTTNLPVKLGARAVPERFVSFTLQAVKGLAGVGGGIKALTVTDTTSELRVRVQQGYLLKLDTTRGAGSQIKSLKLVLRELEKRGQRPREYVDLRVEGKAYYK